MDLTGLQATGTSPTHIRWHVVTFLAVIAGLTYIDRLNLGIVGQYVQEEFHFNNEVMGWILGSFSLGYAIFHIPGGWLGDRFGPRIVLACALLWWSVFTAAMAVGPRLWPLALLGPAAALATVRFLMGAGEAAAIPLGNKMMAYWLGENERALGTSIFLAGVGAGGVVAPFFILWLMNNGGWRTPFLVCGVLGAVLAACWYSYVTNQPQQHRAVNAAELAMIGGGIAPSAQVSYVPWQKLLSSKSIWGLMVSHFCLVYSVYIFFTWFFIYLIRVRGVTIARASFWGSAPFLATIFLVPFWGWLSDRVVRQFGKRHGRQWIVWLGIACSAGLMWSGSQTRANNIAFLQLAAAAGFNLGASAILWTTCNDITKRFSGSVSGMMTTFGSLGGFLSPVLTRKIAAQMGWTAALGFAALVTLIGGLPWIFIDASKKVA